LPPLWRTAPTQQRPVPEVPLPRPLVPAEGMAHQPSTAHTTIHKHLQEGSDRIMTVTLPLVAIIGLIVLIAWRYMGLKVWHAILCLIFGFLLAATTAAPEIRNLVIGFVQWLTKS
jgi:hypothetical protein